METSCCRRYAKSSKFNQRSLRYCFSNLQRANQSFRLRMPHLTFARRRMIECVIMNQK
jgi:hypothetical protein